LGPPRLRAVFWFFWPRRRRTSPVVSCDGESVPFPRSERPVEDRIDRLDLAEFDLVQKAQREEFGVGQSREEQDEEGGPEICGWNRRRPR
jgi:hypothetical protein